MYLEHFSAACPASLRHSVCSGSLRGRESSNLTEKCSRTSKWLLAKPSSASTESGSKRGQMQSADSPISCQHAGCDQCDHNPYTIRLKARERKRITRRQQCAQNAAAVQR